MKVTTIIPVLNARKTVERTVLSVFDQTHEDWELIIVDGGSTDGTKQYLDLLCDSRVKVVVDLDGSITSAVNKGISLASGSIIMPWLCADDFLDKSFFSQSVKLFEDEGEDVDITYARWKAIANEKVIKIRDPEINWENRLAYGMPVIMSNTFVFRRHIFDSIGLLNESILYANDYEFIRRCVTSGYRTKKLPDAAYTYSIGGLSQSRLYQCLCEVAEIAVEYGDSSIKARAFLYYKFMVVKVSFALNALRNKMRLPVV